ncbi:PREDICTED: RING finger protein 10-like [Acropora digitifera]|nr:PREDICTED: RING finger protein 10-like [Acropora digitifera]
MTESGRENMEGKTNVVPSASGREPAPKSKGQSRGRNRRGHYDNYGRYPSQENYRQQRKDGYNQPQRRGAVPDRRPAPRGGFNRSLDFKKGTRPAVVRDCPLVGPGTGSKKYGSSLNHLLNFKYTPREKPFVYHPRSTNKRYTTFNKEQFIQANFQFVVCDSGDYTVHAMDPDVLVEWDSIEQVRIFSHEVPSCPICLYPPVAAKMTRCGHIYCWSCILHYLSLTDKPWHKCPICYEAVHKKALKSVVALESHSFSVEDTITMRLMKRAKNSVLVMPKADWNEREFKPFTINDKEETRYAKLLLASKEDVLKQIVTPEETALDAQHMEARSEQSEEVCYIEVAMAEVRVRE